GVTTDGEITVLEQRRDDLRKRIDDLEEQGRHNNILPGQMRENAETRRWSAESGEANSSGRESQIESGVAKELESRLAEDKKRLYDVDTEDRQAASCLPLTGFPALLRPLIQSGVAKELESRLAEDKKRLDDVDTELDLLGREQRLEEQKEFSPQKVKFRVNI